MTGLVSRLLHRREDPFAGPAEDLQDDGVQLTLPETPGPDAFWVETWRGQLVRDPVAGPRPYAPHPPVFAAPDPGPQADLGACTIWRGAVRDHFVRQERTRGTLTAGPPWYVQWARVYRQRTGLVSVREPDFALWRHDNLVDDIVARAIAAVEAEDADLLAAQADVPAGEYEARHTTGDDDGQGAAA
jgi:hypothetical protein